MTQDQDESDQSFTALLVACRDGNEAAVERLLQTNDIHVNCRDENDYTPLMTACSNGHLNIIRLLLKADGINANAQAYNGTTALHILSEYGRRIVHKNDRVGLNGFVKEAITLLLRNNADPTLTRGDDQETSADVFGPAYGWSDDEDTANEILGLLQPNDAPSSSDDTDDTDDTDDSDDEFASASLSFSM